MQKPHHRQQSNTWSNASSPKSLPHSVACARVSTRARTSPNPRLTPWPANGCTEWAASPTSAKRGRTYLHHSATQIMLFGHSLSSDDGINSRPHPLFPVFLSWSARPQGGGLGCCKMQICRHEPKRECVLRGSGAHPDLPAWSNVRGKDCGGGPTASETLGGCSKLGPPCSSVAPLEGLDPPCKACMMQHTARYHRRSRPKERLSICGQEDALTDTEGGRPHSLVAKSQPTALRPSMIVPEKYQGPRGESTCFVHCVCKLNRAEGCQRLGMRRRCGPHDVAEAAPDRQQCKRTCQQSVRASAIPVQLNPVLSW